MKFTRALALALALALLVSMTASAAESSTGIVDRILGFIKSLIGRVTAMFTPKETTTTTTTEPFCSPPYIQVGRECCVDENGNGICDRDEVTTTTVITTTTSTTTSRATTTTEMTTTTTTLVIECSTNLDCGTSLEVNICYEKSVYKVTQIPVCKSPGTPDSSCYIRQIGPSVQGRLVGKVMDCDFGCDPKTATCRTS